MRYRQLGRTGLRVSEISLGTVEIGMPYGLGDNLSAPDAEAAARLLNHALDIGINFIDTARAYGESEAIIGRAVSSRRNEFFLVSKVLPSSPASIAESLRLLRTDFIDIMMIHSAPVEVIDRGEVLEALQDWKRKGHIGTIGASVYGEEAAVAAIESGGYDCLQIAYSVLDRNPESRVIALAREKGVGLVARSVLLKGALTDRCRHLPAGLADLKCSIERMQVLAAREHMSLPEMAYRYVLSQELPQTALVGTANLGEIDQAVEFARKGPLPAGLIAEIRSLPMPEADQLNPGNWPSA